MYCLAYFSAFASLLWSLTVNVNQEFSLESQIHVYSGLAQHAYVGI